MVELSPAVRGRVGHAVRSPILGARSVAVLAERLAAAFTGDPIIDWIAADEPARARFFASLLKGLGPAPDWVQTTADGQAAAVWVPSERLRAGPTLRELLAAPGLLTAVGPWRCQRLIRFGLALQRSHPLGQPHDYLMLLGVRPEAQRCGAGSALLAWRLQRLDQKGRGAFLETSNPSNLGFYERHGFERLGEFRPVGGGPLLWALWRPPRRNGEPAPPR